MRLKKIISSPAFSAVAFVLAAVLLIFSSVSGARAALTIQSTDYQGAVELDDIGVTLVENGEAISTKDYSNSNEDYVTWSKVQGYLLGKMLDESDGELKLGKEYTEELAVRNTGTINEFVRVSVYKYWVDEDGKKDTSLSPSLIDLKFVEGNGWVMDKNASTDERTMMYYTNRLDVGSDDTPAFTSTLTIDPKAAVEVKHEPPVISVDGAYTTFTTTYSYDTKTFVIEAVVDAVQDHHADEAIHSAWGITANWTDGSSTISYNFK